MDWWSQTDDRKVAVWSQVAAREGLPTQAVEKDWWVTLCLRALFQSAEGRYLIFKGGTSLSKGWNLIARFSEDIDLGVSRERLGFQGELTKGEIRKLRKASCKYVSTELVGVIHEELLRLGTPPAMFELSIPETPDSDQDPQCIFVTYKSLLSDIEYLPKRVKIEVMARSLMEPVIEREICSLVDANYPSASFAKAPFIAPLVSPSRTFWEKIILLHEIMAKEPTRVGDRMARHLYDIEKIMDTEHGLSALLDRALFETIIAFRRVYTAVGGIDYDQIQPETISFLPPHEVNDRWRADYQKLQANMIYDQASSHGFVALVARLTQLQDRIRTMG
jgi:Nucleotidyl transferase AbiEii toxin, Type IV TA system